MRRLAFDHVPVVNHMELPQCKLYKQAYCIAVLCPPQSLPARTDHSLRLSRPVSAGHNRFVLLGWQFKASIFAVPPDGQARV